MRSSLIFLIMVIVISGLSAQTEVNSINQLSDRSYEFSIGISKVGSLCNGDCDLLFCGSGYYEFVRNDGIEFSSRFTFNKTFKERHEMFVGFGLNLWNFEMEIWDFGDDSTESQFLLLTDVIAGYRFTLANLRSSSFFIESAVHGELNTNIDFGNFKLSIAPGFGLKTRINERSSLVTTLSYKRAFIGHRAVGYYERIPHSIGIQLGINNKF